MYVWNQGTTWAYYIIKKKTADVNHSEEAVELQLYNRSIYVL